MTEDLSSQNPTTETIKAAESSDIIDPAVQSLIHSVRRRAPKDAADILEPYEDTQIATVLGQMPPTFAEKIIGQFDEVRGATIEEIADYIVERDQFDAEQWPEDSVGRLMEPLIGALPASMTVSEATEAVREIVKTALITYVYAVDDNEKLVGLVVMRDMLLAAPEASLADIMLPEPFAFQPERDVADAIQDVVHRHYPVYPVCNESGELIGIIKGYALFEQQAIEISAQSGRMVGVEEQENAGTHWLRSLKSRQPWLQLNLVTAFAAAFVVGLFEDTIAQIVMLAVFLPVLAGQSGNTGSQTLALTLRGMTLGDFDTHPPAKIVLKEMWLGISNGGLTGLTAAAAMFGYATMGNSAEALLLGLVVLLAMVGSCAASGLFGVVIPLTLRRLGADPAMASSIFLTTATDIASMGLFLWLATVMVL